MSETSKIQPSLRKAGEVLAETGKKILAKAFELEDVDATVEKGERFIEERMQEIDAGNERIEGHKQVTKTILEKQEEVRERSYRLGRDIEGAASKEHSANNERLEEAKEAGISDVGLDKSDQILNSRNERVNRKHNENRRVLEGLMNSATNRDWLAGGIAEGVDRMIEAIENAEYQNAPEGFREKAIAAIEALEQEGGIDPEGKALIQALRNVMLASPHHTKDELISELRVSMYHIDEYNAAQGALRILADRATNGEWLGEDVEAGVDRMIDEIEKGTNYHARSGFREQAKIAIRVILKKVNPEDRTLVRALAKEMFLAEPANATVMQRTLIISMSDLKREAESAER